MNRIYLLGLGLTPGVLSFACELSKPHDSVGFQSTGENTSSDASAGNAGAGGVGGFGLGGGGFGFGGFEPVMRDPCPEMEPIANSGCNHWYMSCEYGDDPRPACRKRFDCLAAGPDPLFWIQLAPDKPCEPLDSASCPVVLEPSGACMTIDLICIGGNGALCVCNGVWKCSPPPAEDCPPIAPNYGAACAAKGLLCKYGDCEFGTAIVRHCNGGVWVEQDAGCGG